MAEHDPQSGARQAPGFYRYAVGEIEVTAIHDGVLPRPLEGLVRNAELPQVRAAAREAFLPEDVLSIPITTLVLRRGDRLCLVDTGIGEFGPPSAGLWTANFHAAGFDPAAVETVVISHFHRDHLNGLRRKDGSPVFPQARVVVPAAEWAFWMDDARMRGASDALRPNIELSRRVFGPIAEAVVRFEPDQEIVPGLTAVAAPGHTPGHSAFMLSSGSDRLMILSDTANHPALFVRNPDWSAVFDMDPDEARRTRRRLLDLAAAERCRVSFYHAPFPATGFIARDGDGFRFIPAEWSSTP